MKGLLGDDDASSVLRNKSVFKGMLASDIKNDASSSNVFKKTSTSINDSKLTLEEGAENALCKF